MRLHVESIYLERDSLPCKSTSLRFRSRLLYNPFRRFFQVRRATEAVQRLCQCPSERCSKLKVRKVGEGRYHIAGRNVFIRVRAYIAAFLVSSTRQIFSTFLERSVTILPDVFAAFEGETHDGPSGRGLGHVGAFLGEARSLSGEDPQPREHAAFASRQQTHQLSSHPSQVSQSPAGIRLGPLA